MRKVLFFTYDFPYPTNTGGKNRSYHLLKYAGKDLQVSLFSFVRDDFKDEYFDQVKKIGIENVKVFKRKKVKSIKNIKSVLSLSSIFKSLYFDKKVQREILEEIKKRDIDVVHFESYYTAFYICNEVKKIGVKQIFGTQNLENYIYRDYAKYLAKLVIKPFYFIEAQKIKREEEGLLKTADLCLSVTEKESEEIESITGKKSLIIENGIDIDSFEFKPKKRGKNKNILFVGNFSYFPNLDAMKFFYKEVFKKIENEDLTLTVVGKNSEKLSFIKDGRVKVIEFVEDIREVYHSADVFIFPVRIGGGTNFKILEAMALGIPVVAFSERVEGLGIKSGEHLLVADSDKSFKEQILRLIEDDSLSLEIAKNARKLVEDKYSWEKIGVKLNKIWKEI